MYRDGKFKPYMSLYLQANLIQSKFREFQRRKSSTGIGQNGTNGNHVTSSNGTVKLIVNGTAEPDSGISTPRKD